MLQMLQRDPKDWNVEENGNFLNKSDLKIAAVLDFSAWSVPQLLSSTQMVWNIAIPNVITNKLEC